MVLVFRLSVCVCKFSAWYDKEVLSVAFIVSVHYVSGLENNLQAVGDA